MQNTTRSLLSILGASLATVLLPCSEAFAQAPVEDLAETPANEPADAPAEAPAETAGEASEETPAEAPVEAPAEAPAEATSNEATEAPANEPAEASAKWPKLGGHFGLGMPIVTVGTPGTSVVGRDFGTAGIVAGINVGLSAKWSIDFEFIVLGNFKPSNIPGNPSATVLVLDPGVVYNAGFMFVGLRTAMRVPSPLGGAEFGLIPIIGKGFRINDRVAYYIELDLPLFAHSSGDVTFTTFFQTGFGF